MSWFTPRRERLKGLEERLSALEADQLRYRVAMQGLVEECEDILDRSERKRGRAAADLSAANKRRAPDEQLELEQPDPRRTPAILAATARLRAMH